MIIVENIDQSIEQIEVRELMETHQAQYREFCARYPNVLVYYTWEFKSLLERLVNCRSRYLGAFDRTGTLRGVLPLMETSGRYGVVMNSLPFFGSYGGILSETRAAREALCTRYRELGEENGIASVTAIENPLLGEKLAVEFDCLDQRVGQVTKLDFNGDARQELLKRIHASARRNLQRSRTARIEITVDNTGLHHLARIHTENMMAIGGTAKPDAFFELLPDYLRADRDYKLFLAQRRGSIVAGLLVLYGGTTAEYYIPATALDERNNQPSAALIYEAMLDAHQRGYRVWNWGGTWLNQEGVLKFKRKWGAIDSIYSYYTKVCNDELYYASKTALLSEYPYFFVMPFQALRA